MGAPESEGHGPREPFAVVRRGYDQTQVDAFTRSIQDEVDELRRAYETLAAENQQLRQLVDTAPAARPPVGFGDLGGRAQEILRIAEEQARDLTQRAASDADELTARTHAEVARLREQADAELAEARELQLGELEALRRRGEHDASVLLVRARTETEQLLTAARLEAETVDHEAQARAQGVLASATLQAQTCAAEAEQRAAEIRAEAETRRGQILAELSEAQTAAQQARETTLTRASELQRQSSEHLVGETEAAARLRQESLAEAERVKVEAVEEAERIVSRAQHQARTIDERARQEFAWRRRQMRHEQDLLTRRKQAMLGQLTSLSALAVQTAESLPEVPDFRLDDFEEPAADDGSLERATGS